MDIKSKPGPGRLAQAVALPSVRGPNLSLHPGYNEIPPIVLNPSSQMRG